MRVASTAVYANTHRDRLEQVEIAEDGQVALLGKLRPVALMAGLLSGLLMTGCAGFFQPQGSSSGTGSTGSGNGDYVYVASSGTNTINGFEISSATLTAVSGSPFTLSYAPTALAVTIPDTFLYVGTAAGIYGYSIGTGGTLTALENGIALQVCGASGGISSLDVSPDGQWLIELASDGATICVGQINTSTGTLTAGVPVTYSVTTAIPTMIKVAPSGAFVFAALGPGGTIVFPFTTATGTLSTSAQLLSYASANTDSDNGVAVDINTAYVYIARSGSTNPGIWAYSINSSSGALSSVTQTSTGLTYAAATNPHAISFNKTGTYLYSGDYTDGVIYGFTALTGQLTTTPNSPYTTGDQPIALAYDNSSSYMLAVCLGGSPAVDMFGFDVTNAGRLYAVSSGTAGTTPLALAVTH
jgi:6-phosphogluconolactonase (cycloisomerase 2 family)